MPVLDGVSVFKVPNSSEFVHVHCAGSTPCEEEVICKCHNKHMESVCRAIHVHFLEMHANGFVCDTAVCPGCNNGFSIRGWVTIVLDGSAYHSNCTVKCAHLECDNWLPASNEAEPIMCAFHTQ